MGPLFAEEIGGVVSTTDVVELGDTGSNTLTDLVEGQGVVALVETGMRHGGTVDHGFVVSEHHGATLDGDAEVTKFNTEIDDLLRGRSCSNKLSAVGGCLDRSLFLRVPVDDGLVEQVEDAGDRATIDQVMIEVGIDVGRHDDGLPERFRSIMGHQLFGTCVDGMFPIVDLLG